MHLKNIYFKKNFQHNQVNLRSERGKISIVVTDNWCILLSPITYTTRPKEKKKIKTILNTNTIDNFEQKLPDWDFCNCALGGAA